MSPLPLLALAALAAEPAPPAPAFAAVLEQAAAAGTPIVLDVFTTWCAPCAKMDQEVFPEPRVAALLQAVRFVRYDAERGAGREVAKRFGVHAYPTVLVLNPDGVRVGEVGAQDPQGFLAQLSPLLPLARARGPFTDAALAASKDPAALFVGALAALAAKPRDEERALTLLARAEAADPKGAAGVAARAAYAALPLTAARDARQARATLLLEYLRRYPNAPQAVKCVDALGALGVDVVKARPVLDGVRAALVAAKDQDRLNTLIYALLALGDLAGAVAAGESLVLLAPDDPSMMDSAAEAYFQAGQREKAVALETRALAHVEAGSDEELASNLERFKTKLPTPPPVSSSTPFDDPRDATRESAAPEGVLQRFAEANALTATLADACAARAGPQPTAWVRLYLDKQKVKKAVAFDPEASKPLKACLEAAALKLTVDALAGAPFEDLDVRFGPRQ